MKNTLAFDRKLVILVGRLPVLTGFVLCPVFISSVHIMCTTYAIYSSVFSARVKSLPQGLEIAPFAYGIMQVGCVSKGGGGVGRVEGSGVRRLG